LFSPVAGAFLALGCATWAIVDPHRRRLALALAAVGACYWWVTRRTN